MRIDTDQQLATALRHEGYTIREHGDGVEVLYGTVARVNETGNLEVMHCGLTGWVPCPNFADLLSKLT
jgi:hypothetical protein